MKKLGVLVIVVFTMSIIMSSCSRSDPGQLTGVTERPKWGGINPIGMVYVPTGSFTAGQSDQDIFSNKSERSKTVSIVGFYMDDTEITNNEYRQYVYWVRDSIGHTIMGDVYEDEITGDEKIDWSYELDWQDEALDDMYFQGDMAFSGAREMDTRQLNYNYEWIDWQKAAHSRDPNVRTKLIHKEEVNIYPDTLCWIRDFGYSYNEPMTRNYFSHPAYDDYPVVGITWKQAKAFSHWRTMIWNGNKGQDEPNTEAFRLPTETEWEYAARGGRANSVYPWGSYYTRNAKGCLLANFKPNRGNYIDDGGFYPVRADFYFANDYGLYNMSGNVSEWTESAYFDNGYTYEHDLNPDIKYDAVSEDPEAYKRKVIRGGSWKDISYYLQTSTRNWEYQDTSKSYIGFRNVLTFMGRSMNDL